MQRHLSPVAWPLPLLLLAGLILRLVLTPIDGFPHDTFAFQEWTRQMLSAPLSGFYEADLEVEPDHLPGDLWLLYGLGHVWQWLGMGLFIGHDGMIALKTVPILLDLVLAVVVGAFVRPLAGERVARLAVLAVLFNPGMILVSSIWGQWNVLAITVAMIALLAIVSWGTPGMIIGFQALAAAALVKPHLLILLLPIAVWLLRQRRSGASWPDLIGGVAIGGLGSVLLVLAAIMPFNVGFPGMDLRWTLIERVEVAADRFSETTLNAYNLWAWLDPAQPRYDGLVLVVGLSYQAVGFLLFGAAVVLALTVAWRWPDPRTGLVVASAIIATSMFMVLTRIHERYLMDGMVLAIVSAALVPRLRPAAWVLSVGFFINVWSVYGIIGPENWVWAHRYPAWWFWTMSTINLIGFALLLWNAWPHSRRADASSGSAVASTQT